MDFFHAKAHTSFEWSPLWSVLRHSCSVADDCFHLLCVIGALADVHLHLATRQKAKFWMWFLLPGAFEIYVPLDDLIKSTCTVHPFTQTTPCSSHLQGTDSGPTEWNWICWTKQMCSFLCDSSVTCVLLLFDAFILTFLLHCESICLIYQWQNAKRHSRGTCSSKIDPQKFVFF